MKIKKADFEDIKKRVLDVLAKEPEAKAFYKSMGYSKERFAWDAFHTAGINITPLYEYLHDSHIQTALFKIIGEY